MKYRWSPVFAPLFCLVVGCSAENPANSNTDGESSIAGSAGNTSTAGTSTAGALSAGGVGGLGGGATAGGGTGGSAGGVSASAGTGNAAGAAGGAGTGGTTMSSGGVTGGGGATGGGSTSAGAPTGGFVEDDGVDCTVSALPDVSSLTSNSKLPDPFKKLDGTRITTKAEWRCRRQEIRKLAEKFAYGTKPLKPQMVSGTVSNTSISVKVTDSGKSASFTATVKLPTSGTAPYPAIIVYDSGGFGAPLDTSVINSEGIALITYNPYTIGKETGSRTQKQGVFYDIVGSASTTGLLAAWGWGVSRIIDVIEQDGKVLKADAIGVTGCSRFGKGSFLAGVFDQRVALTMPVESGSAGVPIWRGIPGEGAQSLSSAYNEQPWFGDAFKEFISAPGKAPVDTHEVVAMIAPRGLFIMDNPSIANLGPKSAHVAALAGAEVYKALGAGGNITYYSDVQNGNHCAVRPEWATPLKDNIQKFLKKTGSAPGVIKAKASAMGKLGDWVDWTAPTLN